MDAQWPLLIQSHTEGTAIIMSYFNIIDTFPIIAMAKWCDTLNYDGFSAALRFIPSVCTANFTLICEFSSSTSLLQKALGSGVYNVIHRIV